MKTNQQTRREFLKTAAIGTTSLIFGCRPSPKTPTRKPNLVYIFADQWRAQATGYAGDINAITPNLDKLAKESINLTTAVSGCPVCSPYRASLMTGQYPLTTGVFLNDIDFKTDAASIAQAYKNAGYQTAYIGKWHLDGRFRSAFIPREKRMGFEYWKALGCNHHYNDSYYYGDEPVKLKWEGYDAIAQTRNAQEYIRQSASGEPFILMLSWGPPHWPYDTAPEKYKDLFKDKDIKFRPNVPEKDKEKARERIRGYYAHTAALDDCVGDILQTLKETGIEKDTILVFTSDHGDMLYSQGQVKKQRPWDESILVPFLIHYPAVLGKKGKTIDMPFNTPDIMPTLLGLSGVEIPDSVEGKDYSGVLKGTQKPTNDAALITCPSPFGQFLRGKEGHPKFGPSWGGGKEYRGIRTRRYTYVKDLDGPWLMYDNKKDPYQLNNIVNKPEYTELQSKLEKILQRKLKETNDEFLHGDEYNKKWNHPVDKTGTIPFEW